jgi:hypothetical protein
LQSLARVGALNLTSNCFPYIITVKHPDAMMREHPAGNQEQTS